MRVGAATNPSGYHDQDIYLRALNAAHSVDHIEYGTYVARVKQAPLAVRASPQNGRPEVVHPQWPIVPVGVINPTGNYTAGALRGKPDDGVGRHWWHSRTAADFRTAQLPDEVAALTKPEGQ